MNCTRCGRKIETGTPYHRTKRGAYHSECSKVIAGEHPATPSMARLIDATMMGLCYHPALRGVLVAGTAADVREILRQHTASVLRNAANRVLCDKKGAGAGVRGMTSTSTGRVSPWPLGRNKQTGPRAGGGTRMKIYLIVDRPLYEGFSVVAAYADKGMAEKKVAQMKSQRDRWKARQERLEENGSDMAWSHPPHNFKDLAVEAMTLVSAPPAPTPSPARDSRMTAAVLPCTCSTGYDPDCQAHHPQPVRECGTCKHNKSPMEAEPCDSCLHSEHMDNGTPKGGGK